MSSLFLFAIINLFPTLHFIVHQQHKYKHLEKIRLYKLNNLLLIILSNFLFSYDADMKKCFVDINDSSPYPEKKYA